MTPATSAIPVPGSTGCPLEPDDWMQFAAQRGLIDHPGGFRFVVQRGPVNGDQDPVGAGLPVRHDDVGVQVRIPAPRGFVLVGDPPPDPGAASRSFSPVTGLCTRVYPACSVQVLHRLVQPLRMCASAIALVPTSSSRSARSSDTLLGAANVRSKPCTPRVPKVRPRRAVRRDPVIKPPRHHRGICTPAPRCASVKPDQRSHAVRASPATSHTGVRVSCSL